MANWALALLVHLSCTLCEAFIRCMQTTLVGLPLQVAKWRFAALVTCNEAGAWRAQSMQEQNAVSLVDGGLYSTIWHV